MHEHEWLIAPDNIGVWCRCGETMTLEQLVGLLADHKQRIKGLEEAMNTLAHPPVVFDNDSPVDVLRWVTNIASSALAGDK